MFATARDTVPAGGADASSAPPVPAAAPFVAPSAAPSAHTPAAKSVCTLSSVLVAIVPKPKLSSRLVAA